MNLLSSSGLLDDADVVDEVADDDTSESLDSPVSSRSLSEMLGRLCPEHVATTVPDICTTADVTGSVSS